ncbi:Hsp20/alpha crystallin family protein [Verrucomicrobiales bacterium]|jgi:HSP20 family protein|nr:Hsp20/alpha crystallin family protein [Verrucomicrobiales bacterium]
MSDNNELSCTENSSSGSALSVSPSPVYKPRYSSHYSDDQWEILVQLAGVKKEQLTVKIENEIMEIEATRLLDAPEDWKPLAEYPAEKNYRLRLDVGPEVNPEGVTAELTDGVLDLRLPLREEVKPRTIEVK